MAAITPITFDGNFKVLRNATAQANVGQTDWVSVPSWAKYLVIYFNLTAVAGSTPLVDFKLQEADPVAKDDSYVLDFADWNGVTQHASALFSVIHVGPGITGIADDDTAAVYKLNAILPPLLGFKTTFDRSQADETYTYTLAAKFSGR